MAEREGPCSPEAMPLFFRGIFDASRFDLHRHFALRPSEGNGEDQRPGDCTDQAGQCGNINRTLTAASASPFYLGES